MLVDHPTPHWRAWLGLGVALFGLNFALSFHNLWPTPWVTTRHEVSVEIAVVVLLLALLGELRLAVSPRVLRWLALILVLFILGRYMEVTAPALYGRSINLYWDAPHLPRVAAMLTEVLPSWQVWLLATGVVTLLFLLYRLSRWLLTLLLDSLAEAHPRRFSILLSAVLVVLYTVGQYNLPLKTRQWFSHPVSMTFGKQFGFLYEAIAVVETLDRTAKPLPHADLQRLAGADVLILFFESYGATTLDRPDFEHALTDRRAALAEAIYESGRRVASARVRSPTFGGASWLAHSSFLSGIEVTENHRYKLLLTTQRDTLVHRFAAKGYRTVGLMPGLRRAWPEGAFYGYEHIYDASNIDYRGPAFGWWRIPDQFALARLDVMELAPQARRPLLAVMTSITSHAPFRSVPPYQADWQKLLGPRPFGALAVGQSSAGGRARADMAKNYVSAVEYVLAYLAGYLEYRAGDDLVLVIIGDHQPPARVSGPDASWDVPVHVIARNPSLIEALHAEGFEAGLKPNDSAIGPMHELAGRLLHAFSGKATTTRVKTLPEHPLARSSVSMFKSRVDIASSSIRR